MYYFVNGCLLNLTIVSEVKIQKSFLFIQFTSSPKLVTYQAFKTKNDRRDEQKKLRFKRL